MSYKKIFDLDCNENTMYYDFDTDINQFFRKLRNKIKNNFDRYAEGNVEAVTEEEYKELEKMRKDLKK